MNIKMCLAGAALLLLSGCAADHGHRMAADGKGCQMMAGGKAMEDHTGGDGPKRMPMDGCGMMQDKNRPRRDDHHRHAPS